MKGTDIIINKVDFRDHDVHVVRAIIKRGTHHVHVFSATVVWDIAGIELTRGEAKPAVLFSLWPLMFISPLRIRRREFDVIFDVLTGLKPIKALGSNSVDADYSRLGIFVNIFYRLVRG